MLFALLLIINIIICIALVCIVLLQQSEGGALGMGGGPSGFMTARGAGDLLTRTTWILATTFIVLCLGLTLLQSRQIKAANRIDVKAIGGIDLKSIQTAPATPAAPAPTVTLPAPAPSAPITGGVSSPITLQAPSPSLGTTPSVPATK